MEIIKTENGFLTILTGKTDMGKSTITVYDASECLKMGKRVLFFSYEYCQSIIYNKLLQHFNTLWGSLLHLDIVDAAGLSVKTLVDIARAKKESTDIIYVDYLDLLRLSSFHAPKSEEEDLRQIQDIVSTLSDLAKELGCPIVLLSQTGASSDFEKTIARLNAFSERCESKNVIKMFIGKGNIIDSRINYDDIVHIILVDGYDLRHFSSINIKEIYKDAK